MAAAGGKALVKAAQDAIDKGDYATAFAMVPDPATSPGVPYPLLVCRGIAATHLEGKHEAAEAALLKATELQPDLPKAWKALADLYEGRGQWTKAMGPLERMVEIARSKGNRERAVAVRAHLLGVTEKAGSKNSAELREMYRAFVGDEEVAAEAASNPSLLGPAYLRLLHLEEKRLELQPEKRGELLPFYEALLRLLESTDSTTAAAAAAEADGGEGEGDWRAAALGAECLPRMVDIVMTTSLPVDWSAVVATAQRLLRVSPTEPAAMEARVLGWWYTDGGNDEEEEIAVLKLARELLRARPASPVALLHVGARLLANGHYVPQALDYLTRAYQATPRLALAGSLLSELHALRTSHAHTDAAAMAALLTETESLIRAEVPKWGLPARRDLPLVALRCRARTAEWMGRGEEAKALYEKLAGTKGGESEGALGLASLLLKEATAAAVASQEESAETVAGSCRRVIELLSGSPSALAKAMTGRAHQLLGEGGRARALLLEATAAAAAAEGSTADDAPPALAFYYLGLLHLEAAAAAGSDATEPQAAQAAFLKAAQADPTHGPTFRALGLWYRDHGGDILRAEKCLRKAVSLDPLDEAAGEALSALMLSEAHDDNAEKEEAAAAVWLQATRAHAGAAWAWRWLALTKLRRHDEDAAVTHAQYAIRADPSDRRGWATLGRAYQRLGKTASALKALERAKELGAAVGGELGSVQIEAGLVEEAVATLAAEMQEQQAGQEPMDPLVAKELAQGCLTLAYERLAEGFRGRALAALAQGVTAAEAATGSDSLSSSSSASFACLHKLTGDLKTLHALVPAADDGKAGAGADMGSGAVAAYAQAHALAASSITRDDGNEAAAAAAERARGKVDEGLAWLALRRKRRMEAGDGSLRGQVAPSSGHEKEEETARARACFTEAIQQHDVTCADAWVGLGLTYEGQPLLQQHCFVRALQLEASPAAWANLGILYAKTGREDLAREALRGLQLVQEHPMMWIGLGLLLEERGQLPTAREAYRAALEVGAHPEAQLGLAICSALPLLYEHKTEHDVEAEDRLGNKEKCATPEASKHASLLLGEALAHALMAADQRPAHLPTLMLLGDLLLQHARHPHAAVPVFERAQAALVHLPEGEGKELIRGIVARGLGRARAAAGCDDDNDTSASQQEQHLPPLLLRLRSLVARGEWGEAARLIEEAGGGQPSPELSVVRVVAVAMQAGAGANASDATTAAALSSLSSLPPAFRRQLAAAAALAGVASPGADGSEEEEHGDESPLPAAALRKALVAEARAEATIEGGEGAQSSQSSQSLLLAGNSRALHAFPSSLAAQAALAHRLAHWAATHGHQGAGSADGGAAVAAAASTALARAHLGWAAVESAGPDDEERPWSPELAEDLAQAAAAAWGAEACGLAPISGRDDGDAGGQQESPFCKPLRSLLKCIHLHPDRPRPREALAHALAAWGGLSTDAAERVRLPPASTTPAASPRPLLRLAGAIRSSSSSSRALSEEEAALVAECRRLASQKAQLAAASDAYKRALGHPGGLGSRWVDGWREWAEVLYLLGRRQAAARVLSLLLDRFPSSLGGRTKAAVHLRLAEMAFRAGDKEEAARELSEAAQATPGQVDAAVHVLRAKLSELSEGAGAKQAKQVQSSLKKASELRPHCPVIQSLAEETQ